MTDGVVPAAGGIALAERPGGAPPSGRDAVVGTGRRPRQRSGAGAGGSARMSGPEGAPR
ncbi:hypothetical protein [Pseudonocardia endophytica]|uniref:hypothetical protein n=1 Tax=Pseudonocardia endophytica TaxID=401976 RepID=UPI0014043B4D|nr:hypothetical protein [Pseudonocardia endophytica]